MADTEMPIIHLTIDGQPVSGQSGETVLELARRHGIEIPTLCQLPGISLFGGCRLCLVELAGTPRPVPACMLVIQEGQVVTTANAQLQDYRRLTLELMLAERDHICAVCVQNGDCELQWAAAREGVDHVRCDYLNPSLPIDASHELYVLDHNRCILCIRVCAAVEGAHTWQVAGRGIDSRIVADLGVPWGQSQTCTSCGKCVHVCPTGALFRRGSSVAEMEKKRGFLLRILEGRRVESGD